ncbi:transposase [Rhodanobacter sp. TND4EL1]
MRRRFTKEFKARAAAMVLEQGQSIARVCIVWIWLTAP